LASSTLQICFREGIKFFVSYRKNTISINFEIYIQIVKSSNEVLNEHFMLLFLLVYLKKHVVGCDAKAFNICSSILDTLCFAVYFEQNKNLA
jgi:hypothetical protein